MKKRGGYGSNIVIFILFVILLLIVYFLYQTMPRNPEIPDISIKKPTAENNPLSNVEQFYPNMKFNHNSISYSMDTACSQEQIDKVIRAFNNLSADIEIISFYQNSENPDIEVTCSDTAPVENKDYFVAGEGGAKEVIPTGQYNVITQGVIILHNTIENTYKCDWPNLETHELLHVFGFDHSPDENSIMYPILNSCDQTVDESIIEKLKELYSQKDLPDLYFEEASAIKRGRYLELNLSIRNSGVIDSDSFSMAVIDGKERVESFDFKKVPFGAGVNFEVTNIKLSSSNSNEIQLVIDPDNTFEELDKENNKAILTFSQ